MATINKEAVKKCSTNNVMFGHSCKNWAPKNINNLFARVNKTYTIDPNITIERLAIACKEIEEIAANKGKILFVCTKKIGCNYIKKVADELNMPHVTKKWFAGTITNFIYVVKKMIKKSENLNALQGSKHYNLLSKKEQLVLKRSILEREKTLDGINKKLYKTPNAIVIVDLLKENNAFKEAVSCKIPVFGLMDTNFYSDDVTYPIPCNDDSLSSITFVIEHLKNAILKGLARIKENSNTEDKAN